MILTSFRHDSAWILSSCPTKYYLYKIKSNENFVPRGIRILRTTFFDLSVSSDFDMMKTIGARGKLWKTWELTDDKRIVLNLQQTLMGTFLYEVAMIASAGMLEYLRIVLVRRQEGMINPTSPFSVIWEKTQASLPYFVK
jgi:hypothetical protein